MKSKLITLICVFLFVFDFLKAEKICPYHWEEYQNIRSSAVSNLVYAFKLSKLPLGSIALSPREVFQYEVEKNSSYTDYASTFNKYAEAYIKKGLFLSSNQIYLGLDEIGNLYIDLYSECIEYHQNFISIFRRGKVFFERGFFEESFEDIRTVIEANKFEEVIKDAKINPEYALLMKGQSLLEIGDYEEAVLVLSKAIEMNPQNKEVYFHRAAAYFETGNFDDALKDFLLAEKGKSITKSFYEAPLEFQMALNSALCKGIAEGAVDFVPSLCNTAYGLGEALWAAHVLNPQCLENAKNFTNSCYEISDFIVDYCKNIDSTTLENYIDQIQRIHNNFSNLSVAERGELIGYAIGKYGVDIFAGGVLAKGCKAFTNLKNANRLCNLEALTFSQATKEANIVKALEHSTKRENFFKGVKYNYDSHNKHVLGHNDFQDFKSVWEHSDPEGLLKKFAGKGKPCRGAPGEFGYKETIDFKEHIGIWKDGKGNESLPTTRGTIHYGKKGAHIVPSKPNPKKRLKKREGL